MCGTNSLRSCQLTFANTYHLLLQPGPEIIKEAGGLHKFMRRGVSTDRNSDGEAALPTAGALITDSGGFQVFSMMARTLNLPEEVSLKGAGSKSKSYTNADESLVLKVSEKGVLFRSYRDGSKILLTPETTVQTQHDIGADIIIPLDELLAYSADEKAIRESLARTHRWETRSLREHLSSGAKAKTQAMFAVLHGGMDPKLRAESIDYLTSLPFDGWAVGGSFGKDRNDLATLLAMIGPHMEAVQRAQGTYDDVYIVRGMQLITSC
jgi:queuine tRNA-ribosyltransferase